MTSQSGLNVAGYTSQSAAKVAAVNDNKRIEERLLRQLDELGKKQEKAEYGPLSVPTCDPRWLAVARTHFEQGFMALNRSIFKPERIELPEDHDDSF